MSMSMVLLIFGVVMAAIVYMQCDPNNPFTLHRRSTKDLVEEVLADPILIVLHAYHTSDEQLKLGYGQLAQQLGSLRELNRRKDVCHCIQLVMRELAGAVQGCADEAGSIRDAISPDDWRAAIGGPG